MAEKVATVRSITEVAPDVLVLDVEPTLPPSLAWRAGQFISIRCAAGGDLRRSYSIASLASTGRIALLVKLVPNGAGSDFFRALRVGDPIHFTGPMGFFVPDLAHTGDVVLAATGTGIAAALPIAEETLARPSETGRVILYWGMRDEDELYWLDKLRPASPRFSFHLCLSRPAATYTGLRGHINEHILAAVPTLDQPVFYLVGNGNMVRDLKQALIDAGVDRKKQLRQEIFYPASPTTPPPSR